MAGSDGFTSVNLTSRKQWVGYADGPTTYSLSFATRLLKRKNNVVAKKLIGARSGNVGIGGNIYSDKNGAINRTGAAFTYAYHIHFKEGQLSFGLTGSFEQVGIDKSLLGSEFLNTEPAKVISAISNNVYIPDAATGVYYMYRNFYTGLSIDQIFQSGIARIYHNVVNSNSSMINYTFLRQYYYVIGYNIPFGENYNVEPFIFLRTDERGNNLVDFTIKATYRKSFWMGYAFRTDFIGDNTSVITVGFRVNSLYFGYGFEYQNSAVSMNTYGTNELIIAYRFGDSERRYRWLDRY